MYRFSRIVSILYLIWALSMALYFFHRFINFKRHYFLKDFSTFDFIRNKSPIIIWNRNNSSDKYCVWFNFTKASKTFKSDSVSLCIHGSIGYSKFVFDHAQNWDASISVALLVDSFGFTALRTYFKLYKCRSNASEKVSTHLVWKQQNESCSSSFIMDALLESVYNEDLSDNCDVEDHIKNGLFNYSSKNLYYPNSLRNIARNGANKDLHLIADIENHFSNGASNVLSKITKKHLREKSKTAIIVRRFEYNISYDKPRTIKDLFDLYKTEQAFEFHHFFYAIGHSVPGLSKWFNYSRKANATPTLYPVKYRSSIWEPQLIVHSSAPYHYEGFSLMRDQTALPYELCRAGYKFAVASHAFSFHKGIKLKTKNNNNQNSVYALIADERSNEFKKYLDDEYGNLNNETCKAW